MHPCTCTCTHAPAAHTRTHVYTHTNTHAHTHVLRTRHHATVSAFNPTTCSFCPTPNKDTLSSTHTSPTRTHAPPPHQIELFKQVAVNLPWLGGSRSWFFDCMSWEQLFYDINSPNGTCLIVPSRIASNEVSRMSWVVDKEGEGVEWLAGRPMG